MIETGLMEHLIQTGARFHQAGCNGCIGMGQAPATALKINTALLVPPESDDEGCELEKGPNMGNTNHETNNATGIYDG